MAFAADGKSVGITSPRGGRLHLFDNKGGFLARHRRADVCGLAPGRSGFVATDGLGGILSLQDATLSGLTTATRAWDNHLVAIDG